MECTFLYLFICYLTTLIPLIEYAQRKWDQEIPKTLAYKYIYLFILLFFLLYRFRTLQILPPLKIISSSRLVRKRMQQVWFLVYVLVSNWF
jgi:TRAP-type C4-dicarboxylate transport system permease small subunit